MQDIPGAVVVAKVSGVVDGAIGVGAGDGNVARPGRISKGVAHDCEVLHYCGSCIATTKATQVQQKTQSYSGAAKDAEQLKCSKRRSLRHKYQHICMYMMGKLIMTHCCINLKLTQRLDQFMVSLTSCSTHKHSQAWCGKVCASSRSV